MVILQGKISADPKIFYEKMADIPIFLFVGEVAGVVFPLGDKGGHVGGEVAVEVHLLAGLGVDETEGLGVQGLAGAQLEAVVDELGIAG